MQFIRRSGVRAAIGVVLVAVLYGGVAVLMPYHREQRIARRIEAVGGKVDFQFCGPNWIPQSVLDAMPLCARIRYVNILRPEPVPADVFSEFESLHRIEGLGLSGTQIARLEQLKGKARFHGLWLSGPSVTDTGLEHVAGLTNLKTLHLYETQVTDAGLEHLSGLTSLKNLFLHNTQTTSEGRAKLQIALPNCRIISNPRGQVGTD
jgi:hypothetical protein